MNLINWPYLLNSKSGVVNGECNSCHKKYSQLITHNSPFMSLKQ